MRQSLPRPPDLVDGPRASLVPIILGERGFSGDQTPVHPNNKTRQSAGTRYRRVRSMKGRADFRLEWRMLKPGSIARYAAAFALILGVSSPAMAQNLQNAGSIGQRLPGELLSAGLVRQQEAIISPRITPEITDQAPVQVSPRNQFFVDAIQIIFDQLNQAIFLFSNVIRAQLGGTPLLPSVVGTLSPSTPTATETGLTALPDAGAVQEDGSTVSDPGATDAGTTTSTELTNGTRGGQRARRLPGQLEARSRLRSAEHAAKR